jgi:hypothetical protein
VTTPGSAQTQPRFSLQLGQRWLSRVSKGRGRRGHGGDPWLGSRPDHAGRGPPAARLPVAGARRLPDVPPAARRAAVAAGAG